MREAARVQAAIEILDRVIEAAHSGGAAADTIVADWIRGHRYAGSKDKRAIRDYVYAAIRAFGETPPDGRTAMGSLLGAGSDLFDGSAYGPAPLAEEESRWPHTRLPHWLAELIATEEHDALLARAPLDLRVNRLRASRDEVLDQFDGAIAIDGLPDGLRLSENIRVEQHAAWEEGKVEVQDAGSQWIVAACGAVPEMTVVDLCAGAGGKTLALAAAMGGRGRLIACDTNRDRLQRLAPRAARAGASMIETRLLNPGQEAQQLRDLEGQADVVLVDAPCSGSGTLRRNPEARWRLTPERLDRLNILQAHVLSLAAPLVRPGGALVYAVCSLIRSEGAGAIEEFLKARSAWDAEIPPGLPGRTEGPGRLLTPAHDGTDGFFVARLARRC